MVRFDEGKEKKRREERNQIDLEIHSNDFSFQRNDQGQNDIICIRHC